MTEVIAQNGKVDARQRTFLGERYRLLKLHAGRLVVAQCPKDAPNGPANRGLDVWLGCQFAGLQRIG